MKAKFILTLKNNINIIFFSFLVTVYAPLIIFFHNISIILYDQSSFYLTIFISIFFFITFIFILSLLAKREAIINSLNIYLTFILSIKLGFIYEFSIFSNLLADIILILLSIFISRKYQKKIQFFFCILSIILLFDFSLKAFKSYSELNKIFEPPSTYIKKFSSTNQKKIGNVYHFVFDAFQFDVLKKILKEGKIKIPDNFIVYDNFYTEFQSTNLALNFLIESNDYKRLNYNNSVLHQKIFDNGNNIYLYTVNEPVSKFASQHITTYDMRLAYSKTSNYKKIILLLSDHTFLKLSPLSLKKYLNKYEFNPKKGLYGFSISDWINKVIFKEKFYNSNLVKITDWPYWSYKVFLKLLNDEKKRSNYNNYIFSHFLIPHGPYVLDKEGNFMSETFKNLNLYEKYEQQAIFSFVMLNNFIGELKKQNKYDQATIIVHSDHGYFFSYEDINNNKYTASLSENEGPVKFENIKDLNQYLNSWSKGLLLIKYSENSTADLNNFSFIQTNSIKKLIKKIFLDQPLIKPKNIVHYISNDEYNIKYYNLIKMNKFTNEWEFIEEISKNTLVQKLVDGELIE